MQIIKFLTLLIAVALMTSCSSTKKIKKCNDKYSILDSMYRSLKNEYAACREQHLTDLAVITALEGQSTDAKTMNRQLLDQMKDLSIISGAQAESISKSLDHIGVKDAYISELQKAINRKDSMNIALVVNLKSAVGNLDDKDINIKVEKGVVYVDISDKMLFKSGSWEITSQANNVLGKVAKVLLAQPHIELMVEGHTDNVRFKKGELLDNWDLSTKRATAIVRVLQNKYHIPPSHLVAAGRGEYMPLVSNNTRDGKSTNRRTRIVILPQLDQFFQILEKPESRN